MKTSGTIVAFLVLFGSVWTSDVRAQTGIGVQVYGGGAIPTVPFVSNGVRVEGDSLSSDPVASLVDQYNRLGFQAGGGVVINNFEIRYSLNRFGWDRIVTRCVGENEPSVLFSGEIDDSAVNYQCFDDENAPESTLENAGLTPLLLHMLSGGPRFTLTPIDSAVDAFLVLAPGIGLTSYNDNSADGGILFGFYANTGGGVSFDVSDRLAVLLEARYHFFLTRPPYRHQMVANRALARDESSFSAVFDVFQFFTFNVGVNFTFR